MFVQRKKVVKSKMERIKSDFQNNKKISEQPTNSTISRRLKLAQVKKIALNRLEKRGKIAQEMSDKNKNTNAYVSRNKFAKIDEICNKMRTMRLSVSCKEDKIRICFVSHCRYRKSLESYESLQKFKS